MKPASSLLALCLLGTGIAFAQQGDAKRGEQVFGNCAACHSVERGQNNVGPDLHGVFGRKAGAGTDFRYSPALKRSGITWNAESLSAFIADPQKVIPGNRMPFSGLPDAGERADLLAYLEQAFK